MSEKAKESLLRRATERAARRDFFIAFDLAAYQQFHELDDEALAEHLECAVSSLDRLRLCRRPDPASAAFRQEVSKIADYTDASPVHLAAVLREMGTMTSLRRTPSPVEEGQGEGFLLAARDREDANPSIGSKNARTKDTEQEKPEKSQ